MEACAGSQNLQCEPSVPVEGQCVPQTVESLPSVINENKEAHSHELILAVYDPNVVGDDIANLRSDKLVDVPVAVSGSHQRPNLDNGIQDIQSSNKAVGLPRSWEDGYNWRKYGQKHIKGNEFPRSYYKCSHPNCQVKKQVEQSQDGGIADVIYRGKHDHPKPQSINQMASGTISSVQGERLSGSSSLKSTEDKSPSASSLTSHNAKPNWAPELSKHDESPLSVAVTSDNNIGDNVQLRRNRDEILDENDPESKRRCLNFSTEMAYDSVANHGQHMESLQAHQSQSQAFASASSNENVTVPETSHQMAPSTTTPPIDMAASKAHVNIGVDLSASQKKHGADVGVQAIQTDYKVTCPSSTADRLWGDGYNWRKYGQKHIKGSEFPRSYYRCTHPNCQVKKQSECSQDGQLTDVVYKGEHNHPKPQASSHIAVGRILSIQEEGFEQVSSLHQAYDKSSTSQPTDPTEINGKCEPVQACETTVQGEFSRSNRIDDNADHSAEVDCKCGQLKIIKEINKDAVVGINHQQCNPSVEFQGQFQSETSLLSPSIKSKEAAGSPHEFTPTLTVSNSPVYMVTSRGIVPVEVDNDDNRQRQSSGNELAAEESNQKNGLSLSMTERLLENAYHWRKYGQKNIKGSEFPRSYYRCSHPNCQVKMQLERSHDGRIIEIIYKGKHDHPKPQPITRMAIGAILSLEEDRSDRISNGSGDNLSNGPVRACVCTNPIRIPKLTPVPRIVGNAETMAEKLNQNVNEVENDIDMESKRRKKDIGDVDLTPVIRTPREPRVVVETLSEVDVVDDGYRWQKYGRKIVKGNSNPRNYYRCSNGGCQVKKHVERAANNPKTVITTYEGKHNHDLPLARITTHDTTGFVSNPDGLSDTSKTRSGELIANGIDDGVVNGLSVENRICEREEIIDVEPIQSQSNISDLDRNKMIEPASVSAHNDELNVGADQDTLIKGNKGLCFDTPSSTHDLSE
ncbi:Wrky transcription factor susiba2 [Thalictrum thalictroides]|uniref:Wrky transcription factor susiba2 n=1 Tax=Thalictrum thalictroides TaxID=46969 RepID=A0A7J6V061_THATH|nr:Wrky transcription factor susiba2 [Thalictrum thalictroides]